jgi:hypothetical protein
MIAKRRRKKTGAIIANSTMAEPERAFVRRRLANRCRRSFV